jgi:hypothetical protein
LLHHAPIWIKIIQEVHPAGEKEQGEKVLHHFQMSVLLIRAGIPVRLFGPRESPVPGRVLKMCTSSAQDLWFYPSASMAHGVGSKEEILVIKRG